MSQASCPRDSPKEIVCPKTMPLRILSGTCLTARNVLGADGGVRPGGEVCSLTQLERKARLVCVCVSALPFPFTSVCHRTLTAYRQVKVE